MRKIFFIILSLWVFIVLGFVVSQEIIIRTGSEVFLKTVPVDPRDLLRGDYVILNYEIAQLPYLNVYRDNEPVYVVLKIDENNIAQRDKITRKQPKQGMFLKGHVGGCDTVVPFFKSGQCVKFGIESYFVKEGEGKTIEKDLRNGALVRVIVDKRGSAKVKGFVKSSSPQLPASLNREPRVGPLTKQHSVVLFGRVLSKTPLRNLAYVPYREISSDS